MHYTNITHRQILNITACRQIQILEVLGTCLQKEQMPRYAIAAETWDGRNPDHNVIPWYY